MFILVKKFASVLCTLYNVELNLGNDVCLVFEIFA